MGVQCGAFSAGRSVRGVQCGAFSGVASVQCGVGRSVRGVGVQCGAWAFSGVASVFERF